MERLVYKELARRFAAYQNCIKENNNQWKENHEKIIFKIMQDYLPSGSGLDVGTDFDFDNSKQDKLILVSSYHVMNESGYYMHWIDFEIIIKPSLIFDFELTIKGSFGKYQDIKEYLQDIYSESLRQEVLNYA